MKKYIFSFVMTCLSLMLYAQVGVGTTTPSNAAMLDVSSSINGTTFKGFSPPVVTISQRDMIAVTATDVGMLVFVNDVPNGVVCLQYYDGTTWKCLNSSSGTRTVVAQQDFEASPAAPVLTFVETGMGATQSGTGGNPASNLFVSGTQSYGVNQGVSTITFAAVDLTPYSSGTLTFKLGSFATNAGNNGADNGDLVEVYVSTDGGTTFSQELLFSGTSNTKYDFTGTGVIESLVDEDNNATIHDSVSGAAAVLTGLEAQSTVTLLGIPNDNDVVIRIVLTNNAVRELWVIDDVTLYGE
jgi:hypothetical protein